MGFKKLGSPYSSGNNSGYRSNYNQKPQKRGGQSYMWRVFKAKTKKSLFKKDVEVYGTQVFNNKMDAMRYLDSCLNSGYDASILEKWDPTNS